MDHFLNLFSTSAAERALERLQILNFHSQAYTDFKQVETLIKKKVRSESELSRYLKASNKIALSPQTIIKQAVFYHVFLYNARKVKQDNAITFMNHLLQKCQEVAKLYGQAQANEVSIGSHCRNSCARSQVSTHQDQTFLGKQIFLLSKIARPYIKYIMRLISIFDDYCTLDGKQALNFSTAWHLINLLRSVTSFTNHFVMIGRYFMKDYGPLIVLLTQTLNNDLIRYMQCLNRFIRQQNYMLSCSTSHTEESQSEIGQFMNMMRELTGINEELMQVYLGRYFYREFKDLKQPEWINTDCSEFDTIFKIAQGYSKYQERSHLTRKPQAMCFLPQQYQQI